MWHGFLSGSCGTAAWRPCRRAALYRLILPILAALPWTTCSAPCRCLTSPSESRLAWRRLASLAAGKSLPRPSGVPAFSHGLDSQAQKASRHPDLWLLAGASQAPLIANLLGKFWVVCVVEIQHAGDCGPQTLPHRMVRDRWADDHRFQPSATLKDSSSGFSLPYLMGKDVFSFTLCAYLLFALQCNQPVRLATRA
jgi:hypothetical protein